MRRGFFQIAGVVFLFLAMGLSIARCDTTGSIPLVSEILQVEKRDALAPGVQKPAFPPALKPTETITDVAEFLPGNALYYLEVRNGASFDNALGNTPLARLSREKTVARFLKENDFSFDALYKDLPEEFSSEGVRALSDFEHELMLQFGKTAGTITMVGYPSPEGADAAPINLFLADIGRERKVTFDRLQEVVGSIVERTSVLTWQEADHTADYIDTVQAEVEGSVKKNRFFGIVRNFVIVCDDRAFAHEVLSLLNRKTKLTSVLADGRDFRAMHERMGATSHVRGFMVPGALPPALASDAMQVKRLEGMTLFYDLEATPANMQEHMVFPASPESRDTVRNVQSFFDTVDAIGSSALRTPHFFPYQPDFVCMFRFRPTKLQELFTGKSGLMPAGVTALPFSGMPTALQTLFGRQESLLGGEIGLCIMRKPNASMPDWFIAMTVRSAPEVEKLLADTGSAAKTVSGVPVYTETGMLTDRSPAVAVFNSLNFRNLPQPLLVIAASGTLMENVIEQTIGGKANLSMNRDFTRQVDALKGRNAAILYVNIPKIIGDEYASLPMLARALFPGMVSLRARPPLETITSHVFGLAAAVSFNDNSDTVVTVCSPTGFMPAVVGTGILAGPHAIRQQEAEALTQGRIVMGRLNVELQLYATQRGHFPLSLADLEALLDEKKLKQLMSDPGALRRVGAQVARDESYAYVSGLQTNDAPDSVLLYSARPWYYQYAGIEQSVYGPCRLVLTLDGQIEAVPEYRFRQDVLPRIRAQQE